MILCLLLIFVFHFIKIQHVCVHYFLEIQILQIWIILWRIIIEILNLHLRRELVILLLRRLNKLLLLLILTVWRRHFIIDGKLLLLKVLSGKRVFKWLSRWRLLLWLKLNKILISTCHRNYILLLLNAFLIFYLNHQVILLSFLLFEDFHFWILFFLNWICNRLFSTAY